MSPTSLGIRRRSDDSRSSRSNSPSPEPQAALALSGCGERAQRLASPAVAREPDRCPDQAEGQAPPAQREVMAQGGAVVALEFFERAVVDVGFALREEHPA